MFVGHLHERIACRPAIAMLLDEIGHHFKKRIPIAGSRIGEEEMQHAQHESAFFVNQTLIGIHRFPRAQTVSQNQWTDVAQLSRQDSGLSHGWINQGSARLFDEFSLSLTLISDACIEHSGILGKSLAEPLIAVRAPSDDIAPP